MEVLSQKHEGDLQTTGAKGNIIGTYAAIAIFYNDELGKSKVSPFQTREPYFGVGVDGNKVNLTGDKREENKVQ